MTTLSYSEHNVVVPTWHSALQTSWKSAKISRSFRNHHSVCLAVSDRVLWDRVGGDTGARHGGAVRSGVEKLVARNDAVEPASAGDLVDVVCHWLDPDHCVQP